MSVGGPDLGSAHGEIRVTADLRGVRETASAFTALERQTANVGQNLTRNLTPSGAGLEQIGQQATKSTDALNKAALAGGVVGVALTAGIAKSVDAASNLAEATSAVEQVFGDAAASIDAFAKSASETVFLSERAAKEAAVSLGSLVQAAGLTGEAAAGMSKDLIVAAADLASFFNAAGGTEEALQAIRAGLSGESEPLRRFNIFITEAEVAAKALQLGLAGANGELSEGAKIQARAALIFEKMGAAQGDAERTSKGLANSQRQLQSSVEDASAAVGVLFLPAITAAVHGITALADGFTGLPQQMQQVAGGAVAAAGGLALMVSAGVKIAGMVTVLEDVTEAHDMPSR